MHTALISWPKVAPQPEAEGPTSAAVAMVRFLVARLREEPDQMRAARLRPLVESWLDGTARNIDPQVEGETFAAWHRGFQDGLLLALMVEASTYDCHPDWLEEWAS